MARPVRFYHLYEDDAGESHFAEREAEMSSVQFAPPAPPLEVSSVPLDAQDVRWLRFPEDWTDAAHPSPRRQLFILLEGEVEGWTSGGDTLRLKPGDRLLMEDTTGKGHGARPVNGAALGVMIALA